MRGSVGAVDCLTTTNTSKSWIRGIGCVYFITLVHLVLSRFSKTERSERVGAFRQREEGQFCLKEGQAREAAAPKPRIDRVYGAREVGENERSTSAVFAGCSKRSGEVQEGSSRRVSHQHRGSSSAQAVCSPPESFETLSEIASNIFPRQI